MLFAPKNKADYKESSVQYFKSGQIKLFKIVDKKNKRIVQK